MEVTMKWNKEDMEAKLEANNKKFEALRGNLSQMDIHQVRT
jgi:hypothetical protein